MSTSVIRALRILEFLAASEKPLSLVKVAEELEIPRSTAYKILRVLVDNGFADSAEAGTYAIGLKAFEVGTAHLRSSGNLVDVVGPQLTRLTQLGITAHYAILEGVDVVYLLKEDPPALGVQLASSVGVRLPAASTAVGKSCLAWLPAEQVAAHVDSGRQPSLRALTEELALVRDNGFSTDDGDTASGIRCVAAPVFDVNGPRGAIGVSHLLVSSLDPEAVAQQVVQAARDASALLGGKAPR